MMDKRCSDSLQAEAAERVTATRDHLLAERKRIREEQHNLAMRDREIARKLADCLATARFFNIDISLPVDEEAIIEAQRRVKVYELRVRTGDTERDRLFASEQLQLARTQLSDLEARREAELAAQQVESPKPETESLEARIPKIRELVLDRLQAAGTEGQKASEIRTFIEQSYRVKLHDKTVGMTLYRLSKDRLVRRIGQAWFYGAREELIPSAAPQDPSASPLGLSQVATD